VPSGIKRLLAAPDVRQTSHSLKADGFIIPQRRVYMKKLVALFMVMALAVVTVKAVLAADTLADVKKSGVLVAGVKDSLPPFGYVDEKTGTIVGYDIDFVNAIARKLDVKVELKPVTTASRVSQLLESRIDIIAATMTKDPERAKEIDFSHAYFFTAQKFITKNGTLPTLEFLEGKKIGTAKGSTSEQNVKKAIPSAIVLPFDDYPQAFQALQQGKISAVTTDEAILAGLLAKAPNKAQFEIPAVQISDEPYGLGMRKGDKNFVDFVNKTILEMEESGEAARVFNKWFGPGTDFHLKRTFKITADN
jgi:polar amino acid transport system substrate-binding protein